MAPRPEYHAEVAEYLDTPAHALSHYLVVCGPRGCGKTTVVQEAASGREGVVRVTFDRSRNVFDAVAEHLGVAAPSDAGGVGLALGPIRDERGLGAVVKRAAELRDPNDAGWRPTIVAEIDRHESDVVVNSVAKALKRVCADRRDAHVVLVLSDATSVFHLPADVARQKFVWVEDLTESEAHAFFDAWGFLPVAPEGERGAASRANAAARARILHEVGTRPAALAAAVRAGADGIDAFIADHQSAAEDHVRGLLSCSASRSWRGSGGSGAPDFDRLVCELLATDDESGVPGSVASEFLPPPADTADALERYPAVMYHAAKFQYRFYSPGHRRAAERLMARGELRSVRAGWLGWVLGQ